MADLNIDRFLFGNGSNESSSLNFGSLLGSSTTASGLPDLRNMATSRGSLANFVNQNSMANYIGPNADLFRMELKEPSPRVVPVSAPKAPVAKKKRAPAKKPKKNNNARNSAFSAMDPIYGSSLCNMNFESMRVKELKDLLKAHGLKQSGRKDELITRCIQSKVHLVAPMNVTDLKNRLKARGLRVGGSKDELRARLINALNAGDVIAANSKAAPKKKAPRKRAAKRSGSGGSTTTGIGSIVVNVHGC